MRCKQCSAPLQQGASFCDSCGAPIAAPPQDPLLVQTLLNQYIIRKKLGTGGFGAVYEAEQPSMGRKVAIKTLHQSLTHSPQIVDRFHREGLAASRLEHPLAVKMYNSGETEDGQLWIAMEFIEGETLEERLRKGRRLSPSALVDLLRPICEVLEEAHEKGIIHRDLKPENIMLTRLRGKELPKLLDFGIAGFVESDLTQSGVISGTPMYMAPEQWKGLKHADQRSDLYSLGLIAYRCLSGRLPFEADTPPGWMQKHCFEAPRDLGDTDCPAPMQKVIFKAIEKDPEQRYQTTTEFYQALEASLVEETPSPAPPIEEAQSPQEKPTTEERPTAEEKPTAQQQQQQQQQQTPEPPLSRRTWALFLASVGLLVVVYAGLIFSSPKQRAKARPERPLPETKQASTPTTPAPSQTEKPAPVQSTTQEANEPSTRPQSRFLEGVDGQGTVTDTKTDLIWTAKDNGKDITHASAEEYCAKKGMRLPTNNELVTLYKAGNTSHKPNCGQDAKIKHPKELSLSCVFYWGRDFGFAFVDFSNGMVFPNEETPKNIVDDPFGEGEKDFHRVLCVRKKSAVH